MILINCAGNLLCTDKADLFEQLPDKVWPDIKLGCWYGKFPSYTALIRPLSNCLLQIARLTITKEVMQGV